MKQLGHLMLVLACFGLAAVLQPVGFGQTGKSKLDIEEEEPPLKKTPPSKSTPSTSPPSKSPPSEEEVPLKTPPKQGQEPEEEPPLKTGGTSTPPKTGGTSTPPKTVPSLDLGEEEPQAIRPPSSGSLEEPEELPPLEGEESLYDSVYVEFNNRFEERKIRLLADEVVRPLIPGKQYEFLLFSANRDARTMLRKRGDELQQLVYYEERVLRKSAELLGVKPDQLATAGKLFKLSEPYAQKQSKLAQRLLLEGLEQHDSLTQRGMRRGSNWNQRLRLPLTTALVNLRLSEIDHLLSQGEHSGAELACDQLREQLLSNPSEQLPLRSRYEKIYVARAELALNVQDFATARDWLNQLSQRFPADIGSRGQEIRKQLIAEAQTRVQAAQRLAASNDRSQAAALLREAAEIWPQLPGLEDKRREWVDDYPVLNCAYPELPNQYLPMLAHSPAERHAAALMFESLIRWTNDPVTGPHYTAQLTEGRPIPLERGRSFFLPQCKWSDSADGAVHVLTAEDLLWTWEKLLRNSDHPQLSPAWAKSIARVSPEENNPFIASISLNRDYWQPLSLMDFMVLPKHRFPLGGVEEELQAFNAKPCGTGPYQWAEATPEYVRFTANPQYRFPGLPKIREINFYHLDSLAAVDRFLKNEIDLIYGIRPEGINQLDAQSKSRMVHTLRTPSITFLAPNYRHAALRNKDLRLAIAHAINRESILKQYFRPNRAADAHAVLNGPFPVNTWPFNPKTPLYSLPKAASHVQLAKTALTTIPELVLVFPGADPNTVAACKQIETDLEAVGLQIRLEPVSTAQFYKQVKVDHSFDLAYWRHDFADETYRLWPLFDLGAVAKGGDNFMGFQQEEEKQDPNAPSLVTMFTELRNRKQFVEVQRKAHDIHDHIHKLAIIIPLWQLDTYIAVSDRLEYQNLDPLSLFRDAQHWTLKPPRR